jgi:hypothetical protein
VAVSPEKRGQVVSGRRGHDKRLRRSRVNRPSGHVRSASAPTTRRKAEAPGPACSAGRTIGGVTIGASTVETIVEMIVEMTGPAWTAIETAGAPSS